MARIRSVKPEFWDDRKLAKRTSRDTRLLYVGLWNLADEHGRLNGDPLWVKGKIFPFDDDIDAKAITAMLDELAAPGLECVICYEVEDDPYIFLPKLAKHQRLEPWKVESRLPAPPRLNGNSSEPGSDQSVPGSDRLPFGSNSSEFGTDESAPSYVAGSMEHVAGSMGHGGRARRRATRIPEGFAPTADMTAWARATFPHIDSARETEKFIDYWESRGDKGALKLDWAKTWKNWLRNADERFPRTRGSPSRQPYRNPDDQSRYETEELRA